MTTRALYAVNAFAKTRLEVSKTTQTLALILYHHQEEYLYTAIFSFILEVYIRLYV